jgi:glycosyltransferase involved in cell wall biosynthesis
MVFGVPVVALDAAAVRETLDGGGALVHSSDPALVAEVLRHVVTEGPVRRAVLAAQERALSRRRATDFGALLDGQIARVEGAL